MAQETTQAPVGGRGSALPSGAIADGVEHFTVDGLAAPVEILVDTWGVPHIYAANTPDLYLAQGFNAARDRLFQIDLWRRRGHGLLSEVYGAECVEQDRANRLMLYRGDMDAEWASYGPGVREAVESFTSGINAYIAWALAGADRLPPEFGLYDYEPGYWQPADAVRFRTHGLFYNVVQEVARARAVTLSGAAADDIRQAREPADPLLVPEGVDLGLIDEEVLRVYRLAFAPVAFGPPARPESSEEGVSGSNNWVVGGARTDTGRAILANDPHRAVTLPGLRYVAHLHSPEMNVIGAGEPGLPGISIGHNDDVAFGITIWPADVEDLYVYRLDPADSTRYLGPDGWATFEEATEEIPVRGGAPVQTTLQFTAHGPVIYHDPERGFAVAVRTVWLEPGMAPYLGSIAYNDAKDGDSFVAALSHWGAPAVNQVFATADGDWGWNVAGRIPRRKGWDGSLPVPGDAGFEWEGFVSAPNLPSERRPERGWIATANEENLPEPWDNRALTGTYDWYSYARASRLKAWLAEDDRVSVRRSANMQMDQLSVHALELLALLAPFSPSDSDVTQEFARLLDWDGYERVDSREALVFQIWVRRHLRPRLATEFLLAEGVPEHSLAEALSLQMKDESFGGDLRGDLKLATWLPGALGAAAAARVIGATLRSALAEIADLLGPEDAGDAGATGTASWCWGRLLHSAVTHPAFVPFSEQIDPGWLKLGPIPRGGSGDTVGMAGYDTEFRQSIGSTFRMVVDVGEWDRSVAMNAPGQSGDPRSPHYDDLFESWAVGETFPLLFSRKAVEHATAHVIRLLPGAR